ncbi:flagellar assembly protein FliW [Halodesulfovibrio marinisediminis]|uniref:Flagellar assembly factor FliW n=1 Tax=Halodesulfovibrio marinisediminis DSM 17456 TaxID=1121457 RepID=A0A1N6J517_9BACT|nr:flagellar assembly protein FliW [Halodesulfovibrio marinisediminis]SIO39206.1 flagellar assembly factor FliW [Halodesulfovibrio marinisediminis DSM 17456]
MEEQKEIVIETRIGTQSISMDKVIEFPRGLLGFEDHHSFTLLQLRDASPFLVLQSMDAPNLGFLVADPYSFIDDYPVIINSADEETLQVEDPADVAVLVTVTIPHGRPENTALNLSGPILVNRKSRRGVQTPLTDRNVPTQLYLNIEGK